jgi:hypothetical protein
MNPKRTKDERKGKWRERSEREHLYILKRERERKGDDRPQMHKVSAASFHFEFGGRALFGFLGY